MSKKAVLAVAAVATLGVAGGLITQRAGGSSGSVPITGHQSWLLLGADDNELESRERPPIPGDEQEKRILNVLDEMCRGPNSGIISVPPEDGRILRLLTESVGARNVVEIGTSNGYASIWFCLALRTTGGKLTTFEIDPGRASMARENFKRSGVDKLVTVVEGDAHKTVTALKEPIDILFIDADKSGYLDYFNKLLPLVRQGGLILAHNTSDVASKMQDYLEAITTNPALETIFLHEQASGLSVTLKKRQGKQLD